MWNSSVKESDRLVSEIKHDSTEFLSSAGHVKPSVNPAGPSAKAKYSSMTDSEPVP